MPGGGTKLDITTNSQPVARLLDLTRLISRAGRTLTGIDRVELAYLRQCLSLDTPCFGLCRTSLGYVLLNRGGMTSILDRFEGRQPWGTADRLSRMSRRLDANRRRAQSDLRRLAMARCRPMRLRRMLSRHLPEGTAYLNVGHSNLTDRVVQALRHGVGAHIAVFVHDTIPLDHPEFQRPGTVERFRSFLRQAFEWADLLICNSEVTRQDMARHMSGWGALPDTVVAHLGVEPRMNIAGDLPHGFDATQPFFMCLGTIEPRKNHSFLLDIWENFLKESDADGPPHLVICGNRGWRNEAVFARLDNLGPLVGVVHEFNDLPDAAIAALLQASSGLLFPSFSEGYGLPALEAAQAGTPVICNDLPVFREILGDIPIYANVSDSYLWKHTILDLATIAQSGRAGQETQGNSKALPSWEEHFNIVLKMT